MSTTSVYCLQGKHVVEPEEMSYIRTDNGKGWRNIRAAKRKQNDAAKLQVR